MVQKEGLERDYKKVEKTLLDQRVLIKNLEANQDKMNQRYYDLKNQFNQLTAQNQRREERLQRQKKACRGKMSIYRRIMTGYANHMGCLSDTTDSRSMRSCCWSTLLKTQVEALQLKVGKREQWWTLVQDMVQQDIKDAIARHRDDEELYRHKLQAYVTAYPNFKYTPPEQLDAFTESDASQDATSPNQLVASTVSGDRHSCLRLPSVVTDKQPVPVVTFCPPYLPSYLRTYPSEDKVTKVNADICSLGVHSSAFTCN